MQFDVCANTTYTSFRSNFFSCDYKLLLTSNIKSYSPNTNQNQTTKTKVYSFLFAEKKDGWKMSKWRTRCVKSFSGKADSFFVFCCILYSQALRIPLGSFLLVHDKSVLIVFIIVPYVQIKERGRVCWRLGYSTVPFFFSVTVSKIIMTEMLSFFTVEEWTEEEVQIRMATTLKKETCQFRI